MEAVMKPNLRVTVTNANPGHEHLIGFTGTIFDVCINSFTGETEFGLRDLTRSDEDVPYTRVYTIYAPAKHLKSV
jgi:hypothetical protein